MPSALAGEEIPENDLSNTLAGILTKKMSGPVTESAKVGCQLYFWPPRKTRMVKQESRSEERLSKGLN
jgi:hypothetical protein